MWLALLLVAGADPACSSPSQSGSCDEPADVSLLALRTLASRQPATVGVPVQPPADAAAAAPAAETAAPAAETAAPAAETAAPAAETAAPAAETAAPVAAVETTAEPVAAVETSAEPAAAVETSAEPAAAAEATAEPAAAVETTAEPAAAADAVAPDAVVHHVHSWAEGHGAFPGAAPPDAAAAEPAAAPTDQPALSPAERAAQLRAAVAAKLAAMSPEQKEALEAAGSGAGFGGGSGSEAAPAEAAPAEAASASETTAEPVEVPWARTRRRTNRQFVAPGTPWSSDPWGSGAAKRPPAPREAAIRARAKQHPVAGGAPLSLRPPPNVGYPKDNPKGSTSNSLADEYAKGKQQSQQGQDGLDGVIKTMKRLETLIKRMPDDKSAMPGQMGIPLTVQRGGGPTPEPYKYARNLIPFGPSEDAGPVVATSAEPAPAPAPAPEHHH